MLNEVAAAVASGQATSASAEDPGLNIRTSVSVENVTQAAHELPARSGVFSGPSIDGYRPEAMFEQLVRRTRNKAARQQARRASADLALLIVDLSSSELTSELRHDAYRRRFEQTLDERLGNGLLGYDAVAFCEGQGWRDPYLTHFLRHEPGVDAAFVQALLG